ncbi:uncharacterized protein LOC129921901 [Biomphalaria glabrata]|uniref:Uncharacterized protein LOC129921901 n=1 Tax=Biomphalaria glabrata TaxID=6526 RepID=A0A9W2YEC5_BIOGL|nr:uncharacterized protein LOC129921901 [Biomphalaria glabrata]
METNRTRCDHETGACLQGCLEGYEGFQCTNKVSKQLFPVTTAISINVILGLVILLVLIAALARWHKNQKRGHLRLHDSPLDNKDYSVMNFSRQSECVYEVPVLRGKENSNSSQQDDACDKDGNDETLSIDSTYQNTREAQMDTSAQVNLNSDMEVLKERDDDSKEPLCDDQEVYANCPVAKLGHL